MGMVRELIATGGCLDRLMACSHAGGAHVYDGRVQSRIAGWHD